MKKVDFNSNIICSKGGEHMKKIKGNKGITLVALAVTIVIMLILAGSITTTFTSTMDLEKYNKV